MISDSDIDRITSVLKRNHERERGQWQANKERWKEEMRQRDIEIVRLRQCIASLYNASATEHDARLRARGVLRTLHLDAELCERVVRILERHE